KIKNNVANDANFLNVFGGRHSDESEEISIPQAESYNAPVIGSIVSLAKFCRDVSTKKFCVESTARKILGYVLGSNVDLKRDGEFVFPISIILVNQVFLTREIVINRTRSDSLSESLVEGSTDDDVEQSKQSVEGTAGKPNNISELKGDGKI